MLDLSGRVRFSCRWDTAIAGMLVEQTMKKIFTLVVFFCLISVLHAEPIDNSVLNPVEVCSDLLPEDVNHLDVLDPDDPGAMTPKEINQLNDEGKSLSMIPEPATLVMLGIATLFVFLWRRKW